MTPRTWTGRASFSIRGRAGRGFVDSKGSFGEFRAKRRSSNGGGWPLTTGSRSRRPRRDGRAGLGFLRRSSSANFGTMSWQRREQTRRDVIRRQFAQRSAGIDQFQYEMFGGRDGRCVRGPLA